MRDIKVSIVAMGICIGSIKNTKDLIEFIVDNKDLGNLKGKNEEELALGEAFKDIDQNSQVIVFSGKKIYNEYLNNRNIKNQVIIKDEIGTVEDIEEIFSSTNIKYVAVVGHTDLPKKGCAVIVLGAYNTNMPIIEEVKKNNIKENIIENDLFDSNPIFHKLTDIIIKSLEVTCGLDLKLKQSVNWIKYLNLNKNKMINYFKIGHDEKNKYFSIKEAEIEKKIKFRCSKYLIMVSFSDKNNLCKNLNELIEDISKKTLREIFEEYFHLYKSQFNLKKTIVFTVSNKSILLKEIKEIKRIIENFVRDDFYWKSKNGSLFIGRKNILSNKVVFMNAPGGMLKKGLFYKTYSLFPEIKRNAKNSLLEIDDNSNEMVSRYLYEATLNYISMIILKNLGINADCMVGASMGEISLFLHKGVLASNIKDESKKEKAMINIAKIISKVFDMQPKLSLEYFGRKIEYLEKWYLKCNIEDVKAALRNEKEVFLFIIGSPRDVIISGDREACKRVIGNLRCISSKINDSSFVHTPVMEAAMDDIVKEIIKNKEHIETKNIDYDIYSAYLKRPLSNSTEEYANNIANILSKPVDFSGVISQIYSDGGRIFFDLSSGNVIGNWAKECLKDKKDAQVISIFSKDEYEDNFLNIFAKLIAYHANIDYDKFASYLEFSEDLIVNTNKKDDEYEELFNKYVQRQLLNNKEALKVYLENEKKLLDKMFKNNNKYKQHKKNILWDRKEIEYMTEKSMSDILGEKYKDVDRYPVRARMPLHPFLFVSRILSIDAEFGKLRPSKIEMEYDIGEDFVFKINKKNISNIFMGEASHIGIFLAAYIGIDIISNGRLCFRITDAETTIHAERNYRVGDTLKMIYRIDKFVNSGSKILLFCSYDNFVDNVLISTTKAIGGFFEKKELSNAVGIVNNKMRHIENLVKKEFLNFSDMEKRSYNVQETQEFFKGNIEKCFHEGFNINLLEPNKRNKDAILVSRIENIDYCGGEYKKGYISAIWQVDPSFWVFKCHFKNDPILPGTIMLEGLNQTAEFLFAHAGLLGRYKKSRIYQTLNSKTSVQFRGEVRAIKSEIKYELHVKESVEMEDGIYLTLDGDVTWNGIHCLHQKNMAYRIIGER